MLAGKPVIATPYGGVTDFVDEQTALPLRYRMVDVGEGNDPYPANGRWADPELRSIRAAMRAIYGDRALARRLAEGGRAHALALFSLASTSAALKAEIERIWRSATA